MFLDADDFVGNRLSGYVNEHRGENGWYFDQGYRYRSSSDRLTLIERNFHKQNGSSHIGRIDLLDAPDYDPFPPSVDDELASDDVEYLKYVFGNPPHAGSGVRGSWTHRGAPRVLRRKRAHSRQAMGSGRWLDRALETFLQRKKLRRIAVHLCHPRREEGLRITTCLRRMVAGVGFEPTTFGL